MKEMNKIEKPKFWKRKIGIFGKQIPVVVLLLVLVGGLGSATLLQFYGKITGTATVTQSVTVEDSPITGAWNTEFVAGKTIIDCDDDGSGYSVKNNADVEVPIQFGTTCRNVAGFDDGTRNEVDIDWATFDGDECDGITTEIYGILELTSKNPLDWIATPNRKATLYYTIVGNTFKYKVESTDGLGGYVVVYYPDSGATDPTTGKPWNIANAVNLGAVTNVWTTSSLATNLPVAGDYNANPNDKDSYCNTENGFDNYEHCAGAKIWLMPQTDFTNKAWNPDAWLFETDLIVYSSNADNKITLPAKGGFNFCEKNDFGVALTPDTYTITTNVVPVITP